MPIMTQQYLTIVYILYVLSLEMGGQCPLNCEVGVANAPPVLPPMYMSRQDSTLLHGTIQVQRMPVCQYLARSTAVMSKQC